MCQAFDSESRLTMILENQEKLPSLEEYEAKLKKMIGDAKKLCKDKTARKTTMEFRKGFLGGLEHSLMHLEILKKHGK